MAEQPPKTVSDPTPFPQSEIIGRESASLTLIEVGLGSLLHGLHLPFAGYLLSLNQGFFLSRAVSQVRGLPGARTLPVAVSTVAACLKSLSPAGKRLTPMLAISMQGFLFTAGTAAFGANLAGAIVGSMLASSWSFVQPLLLYTLLYGRLLEEVADHYLGKYGLWSWLAALMIFKMMLSGGLAVAGFRLSEARFEAFRSRLTQAARQGASARGGGAPGSPLQGALRDLSSPLFLLSIALTAIFLWFSDREGGERIWLLLRPLGVGFLLFYVMRTPLVVRGVLGLSGWLRRRGMERWGAALEAALRAIDSGRPLP
jgi:hypothetical protein